MPLPKIFRKRLTPRQKYLLEEFESGRYLRVDEDVDNKEIMKIKELAEKIIEESPALQKKIEEIDNSPKLQEKVEKKLEYQKLKDYMLRDDEDA